MSLILLSFFALSFISCTDDDDNGVDPKEMSLTMISKDEVVNGTTADFEIISHANVKNISEKSVTTNVKMEIIELAEGHTIAICTNLCFLAQTEDWVVPDQEKFDILAGEDAGFLNGGEGFTAHLYTAGKVGTSKIKFIFYNVDDPDDMVSYIATFNVE